jgi:transcriptional regulator with XRE-family HTH domain
MTVSGSTPRLCVVLADAYPRDTAKLAARAAGVSHRTAEAWTTGRRSPAADVLLRMADRCERMAAALQRNLDARRAAKTADSSLDCDRTGAGELGNLADTETVK